MKLLMGWEYEKEFVLYDGLNNELRKIKIKKKENCRVCGLNERH
jgi:hypothetical protein